MKKISSLSRIEKLRQIFKNIVNRFPITIIVVLIISSLFIALVHIDFTKNTEINIMRSIFSLIVTFFFSLGIYINSESLNYKNIKKNIIQIIPILFGIFFYLSFNKNINNIENFIFFILTISGIISLLFFAPYIKNLINKKYKQDIFYSYFYNMSIVFLTSFILGIILLILGSIGIFAIFELFDLSFFSQDKTFQDWTILSLSLAAPIFALSKIPKKETFEKKDFSVNIFFSFLVKYITIPFIYIYFIILYAYSIKVLLNFGDWPKGEVSWMVIGFSIFGYINYVFSYTFEEKNKSIKIFRKSFPFVVIPQIFMLFYAIYLRINQYDITVNRYFVVVFGILLLILSLYYIFSKDKKLINVVSFLTVSTLIISIGPWSVYSLPETRQLNRLKINLEKANILQNNEIIPLEKYSDIDIDLSINTHSIIEYLCDFDDCNEIKEIFNKQYKQLLEEHKKGFVTNLELEKQRTITNCRERHIDINECGKDIEENREYYPPSKWEIVEYITKYIKVQDFYGSNGYKNFTIDFSLENDSEIFPIKVDGYKKILKINSYKDVNSSIYAFIDMKNKKIEIIQNSKLIDTISLDSFIKKLYSYYKETEKHELPKENLSFETEKYKIIFESLNIINPEYEGVNEYEYFYNNGYLLVK